MANNREMLNEIDFEKRIKEMEDRQLLEFVARQTFEVVGKVKSHEQKIVTLENGDKRVSGITGGVSGAVTGIIIGIANYFLNRG